jgi:transcriptional regulator with XRE-family HTH domain
MEILQSGDSNGAMGNDVITALGARLREVRKASGKSQETVAKEAMIGRAYYGKIESGTRNITLLTAAKICWVLGISLENLMKDIPSLDPTAKQMKPSHKLRKKGGY